MSAMVKVLNLASHATMMAVKPQPPDDVFRLLSCHQSAQALGIAAAAGGKPHTADHPGLFIQVNIDRTGAYPPRYIMILHFLRPFPCGDFLYYNLFSPSKATTPPNFILVVLFKIRLWYNLFRYLPAAAAAAGNADRDHVAHNVASKVSVHSTLFYHRHGAVAI